MIKKGKHTSADYASESFRATSLGLSSSFLSFVLLYAYLGFTPPVDGSRRLLCRSRLCKREYLWKYSDVKIILMQFDLACD